MKSFGYLGDSKGHWDPGGRVGNKNIRKLGENGFLAKQLLCDS